jgi:hypothetical protein
MMKTAALAVLAGVVATTACDRFGQAMTSHTDTLARAAGHELTIDAVANMVATQRQIPAQSDVVDAIANLWVDHILLATAASQDSTLDNVDLDGIVDPFLDQEIVYRLRDEVIAVDTMIPDDELRALFMEQQPGLQIRARHILIQYPTNATPAQRDSVRSLAESLSSRARLGEDFAALARQHSQDDGSASQGGDLGLFAKGTMVPPFDEAAFSLEPGQVSDPVETAFGLHIIRVEERVATSFEDMKETFRGEVLNARNTEREGEYIEGLVAGLNIAVEEGAAQTARELADNPGMSLRGRAANRPLVRYEGGALTAGEFLATSRTWQPQLRSQLMTLGDEEMTQVLEGLTRNEVLVAEARKLGLEPTAAERDSARMQAQRSLQLAASAAGLTSIQPQQGETMRQAISRRVNGFLDALLRGEQNVVPLGQIGYSLRNQFGGEVFERNFPTAVAKIEELRQNAAPPAPPVPPDTTGTGN